VIIIHYCKLREIDVLNNLIRSEKPDRNVKNLRYVGLYCTVLLCLGCVHAVTYY
jgi:hypothetical protein